MRAVQFTFVVFVSLSIGCHALNPMRVVHTSVLEVASHSSHKLTATARLPHCTDIVTEYIKLEKATVKYTQKGARDTTCTSTASRMWALLAGHATTKGVVNNNPREVMQMASKLASPSLSNAYATGFGVANNLVDCDNNGNKVCQCTPTIKTNQNLNSCASRFALKASTFYVVEIGTRTNSIKADGHVLMVYVHSDGTTVSIYQASAPSIPLNIKKSTLSSFTQALASLIDLQSVNQKLSNKQLAALDQFCLLGGGGPSPDKYIKEVVSIAIGGGFSDNSCQTLTNNLSTAKTRMCYVMCGNGKSTVKQVTKKGLFKSKQVEVCDC